MVFQGHIDSLEVLRAEYDEIIVKIENAMTDWERPSSSRYTHEDQNLRYPGDTGFIYLPEMIEKEIFWNA